jgi:DNA primase
MQKAQQALAQREAQERAQEMAQKRRPLPAQPTDNAKPRTIDVQAEAVRPVDKPAEELTPLELMKRYDRFGTLRLTILGSHKQERYLEALRKMHEEATQNG